MATNPHGWATTRTGTMFHYFGLLREGGEGYRPDGTPLALCHNAVVAGYELSPQLSSECKRCASCIRYLAQTPKSSALAATSVDEPLKKGQFRAVLRGKLSGLVVEVWEEANGFPGFWMCWYKKGTGAKQTDVEVMLSASQMGQSVTK